MHGFLVTVIYTMCTPLGALGMASLKFVVEAVYLGQIISSNLLDDFNVYKQVKILETIGYVMIRKLASCSEKVKCELFWANFSALNCSSLWFSYNLVMYRMLKLSHNDILRRLLGAPRCTCARTLFVNKRHDNVDALTRI